MRFRSQTDEDRRPFEEAGDRAAQIHRMAAVMATPCPTVGRSPRMAARWSTFLTHPAVVAR